ncbi:cytochrome c oxidase assembly factor CtaG [Rhizobium sp. BK181]|uniref:cytochrome c oxidase assembly protein n=1 Tax=Rhizobium sp. BK181 TaxID=2587072 RepID=UPI00161C8280|nr:cytochrome c oxidase assembly protein [Rhizobium sp. BK181]MBB3318270.1 cytochrome c oxidase assembly factor CtaG [Rhizobium sp. BK181]
MRALIAIFIFINPHFAVAHDADQHTVAPWPIDPWIMVPLTILVLLYSAGVFALTSRRPRGSYRLLGEATLFWAGLATLVVALVSPLHELGEHLFSVHMVEHELVMIVAAPCLVLARPIGSLMWGMPRRLRHLVGKVLVTRFLQTGWRLLTVPFVATVLHGLAIWSWHVPALFDPAVTSPLVHRLQHLSFFLTGVFFWWAVIWRCDGGAAAWHLFVTMMHTTMLGALITFAPRVLYVVQTRSAPHWGMTPLEDQQLAGAIMWVPGGLIYGGAALWLMAIWIHRAGKGGKDAPGFDVV